MAYFNNIPTVKYEGTDTKNLFAFRHYNPEEVVLGKTMKEHLHFALAFWHTITMDGSDPFGYATMQRDFDDSDDEMVRAHHRVDAFFEIMQKLGMEYFCFHDVDIAPQGNSLTEFYANLDEITDHIKEKMDETGIKLLWNTANMFSHPRYMNGVASSNSAEVFAYGAAQVKKGLDLNKKLNGANYVFWGGREGYESLLNTDLILENDNMGRFFHMAVDYAKSIDHLPQFLIEPKPKEPMKHQYDFDAATAMAFLQKYDLTDYFKLNLETNHAWLAGHTFDHELNVARSYNALGSIDANQGDYLLGWDTDEFPTLVVDITLAMYQILKNGGLNPGGINFDAKVRRTSFEMDDLILAHIAGMDTYARALKGAAAMIEDKFLEDIVEERYASYKNTEVGRSILDGTATLAGLAEHALKEGDKIELKSNHLEHIKSVLNDYLV
ncbi:xylose isomerase [Lactococcus nasutitermitis]|uniref:Xylose isomerase n=1 Tax=Lactococcus nasutitermitis TaxID=1652957 RepID=A0ABV9JCY9_9LACT|nr:xylose isomerase [Lactococcus nasutitermitis]